MKAVLVSIRPEWCDLIAAGKKTIEVRKTRPKLETPFKVYIYCTKGDSQFSEGDRFCLYAPPHDTPVNANQSVIGEFVCDKIFDICMEISDVNGISGCPFPGTGLTDIEIVRYLGNGEPGYGWHISQLKLYDRPKYLGRFIVPSNIGCCNEGKCRGCQFFIRGNALAGIEDDCRASFDTDEYKPLRRPPQSWCYVEELRNE